MIDSGDEAQVAAAAIRSLRAGRAAELRHGKHMIAEHGECVIYDYCMTKEGMRQEMMCSRGAGMQQR